MLHSVSIVTTGNAHCQLWILGNLDVTIRWLSGKGQSRTDCQGMCSRPKRRRSLLAAIRTNLDGTRRLKKPAVGIDTTVGE